MLWFYCGLIVLVAVLGKLFGWRWQGEPAA